MGKKKRKRRGAVHATKLAAAPPNERRSAPTPLAKHERRGKQFIPPLMTVAGVGLSSWLDDRMPEMLWAVLLAGTLDRDDALRGIRRVVNSAAGLPGEGADVTLSGLATLPVEDRRDVLAALCDDAPARFVLRPLLVFDNLPAREDWAWALGTFSAPDDDWPALAAAVERCADHQSQEATDVRWGRVMGMVLGGRLLLPREMLELFAKYPNEGDMRSVRPQIRATEQSLDTLNQVRNLNGDTATVATVSPGWAAQFWDACLRDTVCRPVELPASAPPGPTTTRTSVRDAQSAVAAHAKATRTTSAVDARHEASFGFAEYALAVLDELLGIGVGTGILGRAGLRTLLEATITFAYCAHIDNPATWNAYRHYGAGQAKLAFLKLDEAGALPPAFANPRLLEALASEDRWQEFVTVDVGNWAGANLRDISEKAGRKPEYDRYYPWTSAFVHANWAAVRLSTYDLCLNPLHRWHRVLRERGAALDDVVSDACQLTDLILTTLDKLYPGISARVTAPAAG